MAGDDPPEVLEPFEGGVDASGQFVEGLVQGEGLPPVGARRFLC